VDAAELGAVSGDRRHRRRPCRRTDLLVIENVGNLVCPAEFDVGQHARAMVYAITEGEEKQIHCKFPQPELGPWRDGSRTVGTNWSPPQLEGWERPAGH